MEIKSIYDSYKKGLKHFAMTEDIAGGHYLPRIGYLTVGDKFTTNCLSYETGDNGEFVNETKMVEALEACATTPVYGGICPDTGAILISATAPSAGPVLKVVKFYTLPNGDPGVMFQVIKA